MPNDTPAQGATSDTSATAGAERALLEQFVDIDKLTEPQWRALVAGSLQAGAARMDGMQGQIAENTRITGEIASDTAAIREIVQLGRSFFSGLNKFANGCGRVWTVLQPLIKACTVIATAYAAIRGAVYVATHGAPPPTK